MGTLEMIVVWVIVVGLAALAGRRLWRVFTRREPCGGCGGSCGLHGQGGVSDSHKPRP